MTSGPNSDPSDPSPLSRTLRWPVIRQCLAVMIVVGTVLNLINQHEAIFAMQGIHWAKAALTYCVPFFVSLYGAYAANRAFYS